MILHRGRRRIMFFFLLLFLFLLLVSKSDSHAIQKIPIPFYRRRNPSSQKKDIEFLANSSVQQQQQSSMMMLLRVGENQQSTTEEEKEEVEDNLLLHLDDDEDDDDEEYNDWIVTIRRMRIKDIPRVHEMMLLCSIEDIYGTDNVYGVKSLWKQSPFPDNLKMDLLIKLLSVGLHYKILPSILFDHTIFVATSSCRTTTTTTTTGTTTGRWEDDEQRIIGMVDISQQVVNHKQHVTVVPIPTVWKRIYSQFNNKLYRPYIYGLYVESSFRGYGFGKQLLQTAEEYAIQTWKSPSVYLHCYVKPSTTTTTTNIASPALCMYHNYGYQPMMMTRMAARTTNSSPGGKTTNKLLLKPVGWESYSEAMFHTKFFHQFPVLYLEKKFNQSINLPQLSRID